MKKAKVFKILDAIIFNIPKKVDPNWNPFMSNEEVFVNGGWGWWSENNKIWEEERKCNIIA